MDSTETAATPRIKGCGSSEGMRSKHHFGWAPLGSLSHSGRNSPGETGGWRLLQTMAVQKDVSGSLTQNIDTVAGQATHATQH